MEERDYHSLQKGTKLNGRYIIEDVLGEGGFGITYAGRDELLGVKVAVKEYYPQGIVVRNNSVDDVVTVTYAKQKDVFNKGKTKFLEEARVIAKFNDQEGIVNVTDFFEANNTAYIVMEYLDGITLKEYIAENGVLSPEDILELMAPVLESLDEVHKQGLIHRDISPDNIMLLKNGKVKLMDFGAARDYKQKYNKRLKKVTWEKSTLRKWLNKKFMNRAFSSSEQEAIRTTKVINEDNYYYKTDGGNDTLDKIYLLSLSETDEEKETEEAKEYGFTDSYGMTIKYSNYADLDDYQYWWLRTPGEKNISAAAVDMSGKAYGGGGESDMELGIRPVLHLNLLATDDYSYAGKMASDGTVNQVDK